MNTPDLNRYPSRRRVALYALFLICAPLVLLAGLELSARTLIFIMYGVPGKAYGIYQPDPVLGHFPEPDTYNHVTELNDIAFRNEEDLITPKPPNTERIIVYGGSTAFCPQLKTNECWSAQLQKSLRKTSDGARHQVLNGGIVLWSLGHILERAKRELPILKPNRVIIYSGFNELTNQHYLKLDGINIGDLVESKRYGVAAANYPASQWLSFRSVLFKIGRSLMVSGWRHFVPAGRDKEKPVSKSAAALGVPKSINALEAYVSTNYQKTLAVLIKFIREHGAEPIFVIQASNGGTDTRISRTGAGVACALQARVIDAQEGVALYPSAKSDLFVTEIHYSPKGAKMLAEHIHKSMQAPLWSWCASRG
tara:strand:- start:382 stop:1479 length:1098 start_codon:yes stop_codon:yes gene_type:complete